MKITLVLILFLVMSMSAIAQWTLQPAIGLAMPVTGYNSIAENGMLLQFDFYRLLRNEHWSVGGVIGWGRMHHDSNPSDVFTNARLDQIPILVTVNYSFSSEKKIVPYAGFGLGVSLYNLSYEISPTTGETVFNASVSTFPRIGVKIQVDERIHPFVEANCAFVMDGPPQGTVDGDKVTGYVGIVLGVGYRM